MAFLPGVVGVAGVRAPGAPAGGVPQEAVRSVLDGVPALVG